MTRAETGNYWVFFGLKLNGIILDVVASYISILDITSRMIFLKMMIPIDNVEHYLFKGILFCESLICVPWG